MTRTIYLIRHAAPAVPGGRRLCLSRTDLPLSPAGLAQGAALRDCFSCIPLSGVYSSPLRRTMQTAGFLSQRVFPCPGLTELGVGCWEGLTFDEIRQRYPEEYRRRGEDPVRNLIPGGESPEACRDRGMEALRTILNNTTGDIAAVSHAGVNRLLLCALLGRDLKEFFNIPQPYGCINLLRLRAGELSVEAVGLNPEQFKISRTRRN